MLLHYRTLGGPPFNSSRTSVSRPGLASANRTGLRLTRVLMGNFAFLCFKSPRNFSFHGRFPTPQKTTQTKIQHVGVISTDRTRHGKLRFIDLTFRPPFHQSNVQTSLN